jgi:hypothetical protein
MLITLIKLSENHYLPFWCGSQEYGLVLNRTRIKVPSCAGTVKTQNGSNVILQYDVYIKTAIYETSCIEEVMVIFDPCSFW